MEEEEHGPAVWATGVEVVVMLLLAAGLMALAVFAGWVLSQALRFIALDILLPLLPRAPGR